MNITPASLQVQLLRAQDAWRLIEDQTFIDQWTALAAACPWSTTFQLPGYVLTWFNCYRDSHEPLLLHARDQQNNLIALLTLAVHSATGQITAAGGVQAEYQSWLCPPELGDLFPLQALRELQHHFPKATLRLNYLPPNTPLAWLKDARHLLKPHRRPIAPFGDGSDIAASLAKRSNKNRIRQMEKSGKIQFIHVTDPARMEAIVDAAIPLYDARHLTLRGSAPFEEGLVRKSFTLALMKVPGLMHVTLFKAGANLIAAHIGAVNRQELMLGLTAFNPRFAAHSPGKFQILYLSRMLMQQGFTQLDLTAGGDAYKERFAGAWDYVYTLTLFPSRAARLAGLARYAIKQTARTALKLAHLSPNQVRTFLNRAQSFRPLPAAANLFRRARNWFSSQREIRLYFIPAANAAGFPPSDLIRRDAIDDLLCYHPAPGAPSRQDFVASALRRLEDGQHLYTHVENGRLIHHAFLAPHPSEEVIAQILPGQSLLPGTALITDLQTPDPHRAHDLNKQSLATILHDAAHHPQTHQIAIAIDAKNTPLIQLVETSNFTYQGSVHQSTHLGHTQTKSTLPLPAPIAPRESTRRSPCSGPPQNPLKRQSTPQRA